MKFTTLLFVFILFACGNKSPLPEKKIHIESSQTKTGEYKIIDLQNAIITRGIDGYRTYSEHYNYIDDYFEENLKDIDHMEDTISIGFLDNDDKQALVEKLKLDEYWLCIRFLDNDRGYIPIIEKAKTTSYSENTMIDLVPLTLLSPQNKEEYLMYEIAFRGNYEVSDVNVLHRKKISSEAEPYFSKLIQEMVQDDNTIPPRPMTTDTLLLDSICKLTEKVALAFYSTTQFSDSDADYGNKSIFIIENGKVISWISGMNCRYDTFQLKGRRYLCILRSTYATVRTTLYAVDDEVQEIFTTQIFGD